MSAKEAADFCGIQQTEELPPVRVIEDGDVRTIVEAIFKYNRSVIVRRYYLDKFSSEIRINEKVFWNEKMKMLKLSVPTTVDGEYLGQTAYSTESLLANGEEMVAQKWVMAADRNSAFAVINNGTYGSDYLDGEIRVTMLRAPGYSAGKSDFSVRKPYIMEQDRYSDLIDQGEHSFDFVLKAGERSYMEDNIERSSAVFAEAPSAMSFFPIGCEKDKENTIKPFAVLKGESVTMPVFKKAERGEYFVIRLFNSTFSDKEVTLELPTLGITGQYVLGPCEVKTLKLDPASKTVRETNLVED